ncbi:MAG: ATP-dependent metalloprotease FtsH, partial [Deltaproteobacteria bacterium]|nr:ATP-dependent metalloprotease FtsH [Deltaproteobacteria bacterium]
MNRFNKNIALWLGVVLVFVLLINLFSQPRVKRDDINFSEFLDLVAKGEVSEVLIQGSDVEGTLLNSRRFKTYNPGYARLVEDLR